MKKLIALFCALLMMSSVMTAAMAEATEDKQSVVIRIADESELPEGWQEKDKLRVTVFDM